MDQGGITRVSVRSRFRHWPVGIAVLAVALLTTACWRAAPIDGPGAAPGIGTTGDRVSDDKAVTSVSVGAAAHLMAVLASDSDTHTVRLGAYGVDRQWRWSVLDGAGASGVGATTDQVGGGASILQSGSAGALPVLDSFYFDSTTNSLHHARTTDSLTTRDIVDGSGSTSAGHTDDLTGQFSNPSFLLGGNLHVIYAANHQLNPGAQLRLKHAVLTGQGWLTDDVDGAGTSGTGGRTLDNVGQGATVAVYGGVAHVFYRDGTTNRLRHATYTGSAWTFEDLDGPGVAGGAGRTGASIGTSISAVSGTDGSLHVFYGAATGRLRHARFNGSSWAFEDLDGPGVASGAQGVTPHAVGGSISAVQNSPAPFVDVVYSDASVQSLRHAQWNGTAWRFEVVDGPGNITAGGTTDEVGFPFVTGAVTQQVNVAVYGGASSSILHVFTGDKTTGALREECTIGAGILAPANCAN